MSGIKVAVCVPDRAGADCVGLASYTNVANIDIVIACGEISAGIKAQCDVAAAGPPATSQLSNSRVTFSCF
jgi:hypothetical protein